jgi:hypothetical protein
MQIASRPVGPKNATQPTVATVGWVQVLGPNKPKNNLL